MKHTHRVPGMILSALAAGLISTSALAAQAQDAPADQQAPTYRQQLRQLRQQQQQLDQQMQAPGRDQDWTCPYGFQPRALQRQNLRGLNRGRGQNTPVGPGMRGTGRGQFGPGMGQAQLRPGQGRPGWRQQGLQGRRPGLRQPMMGRQPGMRWQMMQQRQPMQRQGWGPGIGPMRGQVRPFNQQFRGQRGMRFQGAPAPEGWIGRGRGFCNPGDCPLNEQGLQPQQRQQMRQRLQQQPAPDQLPPAQQPPQDQTERPQRRRGGGGGPPNI